MDSSPSRENIPPPSIAGTKRPASLLPAFEPLSSSPTLPRPVKRVARESLGKSFHYPTPVPTSSTAILSSSPPRLPFVSPGLRRTHSTLSERAPLSAVPSIELHEDGKAVLLGRSSVSSHYQLSANRLISRVHVQATYHAAQTPLERDKVEVLCTGWNGVRIHCQGKTYELTKGKTFTSDIRHADIMIDVHDARVLVQWPERERSRQFSESSKSDAAYDEENSPRRRITSARQHSTQSSPLRQRPRLASPISPSPAVQAALLPSSPPLGQPVHTAVVVYEDEASPSPRKGTTDESTMISQSTHIASQPLGGTFTSQVSSLSESQEFSDHDEENDPIIHSFGPFGANLLPRMASFTAGDSMANSPHRSPQKPLQSTKLAPPLSQSNMKPDSDAVTNHIINQLAFSRLSSTPLSTIVSHLPDDSSPLSSDDVKAILDTTKCIGQVIREGKDAAGKPLETEFYYIPDEDEDDKRKEAVVNDLRKPGLRNCRKQHKVRGPLHSLDMGSLLTEFLPSNTSGGNRRNLSLFPTSDASFRYPFCSPISLPFSAHVLHSEAVLSAHY